MAETNDLFCQSHLARIEPDDRLVVLARTIQAPDPGAETALKGQHRQLGAFRGNMPRAGALSAPFCLSERYRSAVWSHLELSYFRNMVPADAILDLVVKPQPAETVLLRAEILLTTPSAFVLPRDWQGSVDRPERQASLEYIQVHPAYLGAYRDVMREYCGPAAAKLVRAGRFGTFRAMETAAVLYRDPELKTDWNQIHLCELNPGSFDGFGQEFEAALREDSPDGADFAGTFADLDRMRTVPRWTFNDPVVEADAAVAQECRGEP